MQITTRKHVNGKSQFLLRANRDAIWPGLRHRESPHYATPQGIATEPADQRLRTSPSTAHALPAPVIGIRLFEPAPPGLTGREVIGHEPSLAALDVQINRTWPL